MKATTINLYRRVLAIGIALLLLGGASAKGAANQSIIIDHFYDVTEPNSYIGNSLDHGHTAYDLTSYAETVSHQNCDVTESAYESSYPDSLNRNAPVDSVNCNVMAEEMNRNASQAETPGQAEESGQRVKTAGGTSQQDTTISLNLKEIVLSASFVNERRTPLRLKSVGKGEIEGKAIGKTYPELVRDIPGVYATS
ncbi:MAG: hypothetical protein PHT23_04870, partial [Bacteroidales bacterium]|nr:hypothetical protein [Bacteroidales bacterium]